MLIAVILVLCGLWLITLATGNAVLSSIVNFVAYPIKMGAWAVGETTDNGKTKEELEKENEELKAQLSEFSNRLADYYDVKQENAQLKKYYNIKEKNKDYQLVPASVINRDASENFYGFSVDKGSASGVSLNDAVLTENGLVGWVSSVQLTTCKVTTILSPDTKVSVKDKVSNDIGVLSGNSLLLKDGLTALNSLGDDNKVQKGDIIVTSGIGGVYPSGLMVGTVTSVGYDVYDTSIYATIKPFTDIKKITDVVIVTAFETENSTK